ncbi:hypothetical protein BH10ACI4_BH10ACI4_33870 [soil metagenome]
MTIETTQHYSGTIEMIKRMNALIEYSRAGMLPNDFVSFEADMRARIAALQHSADEWLRLRRVNFSQCSNFTFSVSSENVMFIERGGPPPPSTHIESVKAQKPAQSAGFFATNVYPDLLWESFDACFV